MEPDTPRPDAEGGASVPGASTLAGKAPPPTLLEDIPRLVTAYFAEHPDPSVPAQRVSFGTSGHRGSALDRSFNEDHIAAVCQAVCDVRGAEGIGGPLFLGADSHALSTPATATALEVLAGNEVDVMVAASSPYTPTPAISHAILTWNRDHTGPARADGIVVTPSHNPPRDGGIKYNPPHGGPAEPGITRRIEARANELLEAGLDAVKRVPYARASTADTTHRHDYVAAYTEDLARVIDMEVLREEGVRMGVDPLGGAGVDYWGAIAERYGLELEVLSRSVDPTFRFMSVDRDGKIRMDPSSRFAMARLIALRDDFDVAFACDTDHDRHGIVTGSAGLLPANHYLAAAVDYLFRHRPDWPEAAAVGKTVVTTSMLDRVAPDVGRETYEVPVGFKWFVEGLVEGFLAFGGEESAGASFVRRDGTVWSTDKDGIIACLLAGEMTARTGKDPAELYGDLTERHGEPLFDRINAPATARQKEVLAGLSEENVTATELAGEAVERILTRAPGNQAPIGGLKVVTANGWFAARPSGTEDIYKVYAESFRGPDHLAALLEEARSVVEEALEAG